jgi:hypothetical protein
MWKRWNLSAEAFGFTRPETWQMKTADKLKATDLTQEGNSPYWILTRIPGLRHIRKIGYDPVTVS